MTNFNLKNRDGLVATGFAVSLVACGKQAESPRKHRFSRYCNHYARFFENDKKVDETKKITIIKDQTLLDALKENFKIEEKVALSRRLMVQHKDQTANKYLAI